MDEKMKIDCAAAFGAGPFHVEQRTNAHAEICNNAGRAVAQCSWSVDADMRAKVLCDLLNLALGHGPNVGGAATATARGNL